ncbi:MAG: GFA family protein, partial [Alphaproteobacteria bacterium]
MSGAILVGGCLCGAVRYEIDGAADSISNFHCGMCHKASDAAFVTWIGVAHERLRYTQGVPASYRSSDIASRSFCGTCGSQ